MTTVDNEILITEDQEEQQLLDAQLTVTTQPICKQYAFTSETELFAGFIAHPGWLRIKQGQTFHNTLDRIKQQDISSVTAKLMSVSSEVDVFSSDLKLDDKIRVEMHKTKYFQIFQRNDEKRGEWTLVKIKDICKKAGITEDDKRMLHNPLFRKLLNKRIVKAKKQAIKKLDGRAFTNFIETPWQKRVQNIMLKEMNKYILLSLAPRFGKTITILGYLKKLHESGVENIVLVPASKDLAANASFQKDFKDGAYNRFFEIIDSSLFQNEDNIIEKLSENINGDSHVVLVTDEADRASHTEISVEKIELIKETFNVQQHIAMSGTGIFKAAKIFKDIPEDEITFCAINYTDLLDYNVDYVVKRNFYNVVYDIDEINNESVDAGKGEVLNFAQAFKQPATYEMLSTYLTRYIDDEVTRMQFGFNDSDVVMVFLNTNTNASMSNFVTKFKDHKPEYEVMEISGDTKNMTNKTAEDKVKTKIDTMLKNGDTRKLILFSKGMATRSFSVPQIRKVILFSDNAMTSSGYQAISRSLTYNRIDGGVQEADIIKLTFDENLVLASELFLTEYELSNDPAKVRQFSEKFLFNNSIVNVVLDKDNKSGLPKEYATSGNIGHISIDEFIDQITKFTDTTKYIMVKLFGEGLLYPNFNKQVGKGTSKTKTSVDTKVRVNENDTEKKEVTNVVRDDDEKSLEYYVSLVRCLPYVFHKNIETVDNALEEDWTQAIPDLNKSDFIENLENDNFKMSIEQIFRATDKEDDNKSRVIQYLELIDPTRA